MSETFLTPEEVRELTGRRRFMDNKDDAISRAELSRRLEYEGYKHDEKLWQIIIHQPAVSVKPVGDKQPAPDLMAMVDDYAYANRHVAGTQVVAAIFRAIVQRLP